MSTLALNGARVSACSLTIPFYGAWVADVTVTSEAEITSPATFVVGDLTLVGTVVQQAVFSGDRKARLVGGGGGWGRTIPSKGYSHVIGVKASTVVGDAARAAGETISLDADRTLGTSWAREEAPAERTLNLIVGTEWWIDNDGVTQTKARPSAPVVAPFTLITRDGSLDSYEIATESIAGWLPGATFSSPTVPDVQTVSSVTITASNEGKLRLHVLGTTPALERLRTSIRAIIRAEVAALSYGFTWEYRVAASLGMPGLFATVDVTPVSGSAMPSLTNVPIAEELGVVVPPVTGTTCRVRFVDANPARPEVFALGGTTEHVMTTEACVLLIYNVFQAMTLVNPGPWFGVAMQPLLVAAILAAMTAQSVPAPPGLIAQIAAAAAQAAAMAAGTAPSTTTGPLAAPIAAMATKTLDVSGLFPGLGVP